MRSVRRKHVDVDIERPALMLMFSSQSEADATADKVTTNVYQTVCASDHHFFDGFRMGDILERNIDGQAHGQIPVCLVAGRDVGTFILDPADSEPLPRINSPVGAGCVLPYRYERPDMAFSPDPTADRRPAHSLVSGTCAEGHLARSTTRAHSRKPHGILPC